MATIKGNKKNNKLKATGPHDKILGLGGDDRLIDKAGNGRLFGGAGNDILDGGLARDVYKGGKGDDLMLTRDDSVDDKFIGGAGIDTVSYAKSKTGASVDLALNKGTGAAQFDTYFGIEKIDGSNFSDILTGDGGGNVLRGLAGGDWLAGGGGDDRLFGGSGKDTFYGGSGNNVLDGGGGDDRMIAGDGGDMFIGGSGIDTVSYDERTAGVEIEMLLQTSPQGIHDGFNGIENIDGTGFNDIIEGNGAANRLRGLGGKDTLKCGGGNDILDGGDGDDQLEGGAGADAFIGGAGNDLVSYIHEKSAVNVYLHGAANTGAALGDTFSGIEIISGTIYNDVIQGDDLANWLYGNNGSDTINGRGGNDTLYGGDGADLLDGGANDDIIYAADDTVLSNDIIVGGSGKDTVDYFGASSGVTVDLTGALTPAGAAQGDSFTLVENVNGTYHSDTLRPGAGGTAFGDRGADTIYDVAGSTEILRGGRGNDTLSDSDSVRDYFVLENYGDGSFDTIGNFDAGGSPAQDQFWLPKKMFAGLGANAQGVLDAAYFAIGNSATANHAQIFKNALDEIWFDADGTGGGAAVKIAKLGIGSGTISNLDFVLVDI